MDRSSRAVTVVWFFFFNDTATTEIYTLSLHDALPISRSVPSATAAPTVTWTVKAAVAPGASVTLRLQDPDCTTPDSTPEETPDLNFVPASRESDTPIPPTCVEGPLLVTVRV